VKVFYYKNVDINETQSSTRILNDIGYCVVCYIVWPFNHSFKTDALYAEW